MTDHFSDRTLLEIVVKAPTVLVANSLLSLDAEKGAHQGLPILGIQAHSLTLVQRHCLPCLLVSAPCFFFRLIGQVPLGRPRSTTTSTA